MKTDCAMQKSEDLMLAEKAALLAGKCLMEDFVGNSLVKSEVGKDIKLAADVMAEDVILKVLRDNSPYPILSEEAGADDTFQNAQLRWVVDPLDGTFNFSRRLPLCCVSIGLWNGMKPVLGVIYEFGANNLYSGEIGKGATRNGIPIKVSEVGDPAKAAICTGFPAGGDFGVDSLSSLVKQVQHYKKVRMIGSAALSLAYVAIGHVEIYKEENINFWDVAGGIPLVVAAGGAYTTTPGSTQWQFHVVASNGRLLH